MSFSYDDVLRLTKLLDSSQFDELHLEAEGIKLTLRRNGVASSTSANAPTSVAAAPAARPAAAAPVVTDGPPVDPNLIEIRAPLLGTFYGAPKPGADPFVAIGAPINPDSAVGIIEVMKLMNSISAGVEGTLVEVLAHDGELVEFDQVLMRVRPV